MQPLYSKFSRIGYFSSIKNQALRRRRRARSGKISTEAFFHLRKNPYENSKPDMIYFSCRPPDITTGGPVFCVIILYFLVFKRLYCDLALRDTYGAQTTFLSLYWTAFSPAHFPEFVARSVRIFQKGKALD